MFGIRILQRSGVLGLGEIVVSGFKEKFEMSFEYWSPLRYEEHWLASLSAVIQGQKKTMLLSSVVDPQTANFIFCWPVYRVGNTIFIQQQILMLEDIRDTFSFDSLEKFVDSREKVDEDGYPISEWSTTVEDLSIFLSSLKK